MLGPSLLADEQIKRYMTGLDFLWLEVTPKCNLRCVHCYADSSPYLPMTYKMQYENWRSVLHEAFVLGCSKVQFIGGEPTLYPHLSQLIADARNTGYEFIEVFTNGTLLNDSLLETLKECRVNLAFSFYASQAGVHDAITRRRGSHGKTLDGIRRAVESGLSVRVGLIVMRENSAHLENAKSLLRELGVTSIGVDRVRGIGRGSKPSQEQSPISELCGNCWRGKLCIDSKGEVYPCIFSRFCRVGSVDEGLQTVLGDEKLIKFRSSVRSMTEKSARLRDSNVGCYPDQIIRCTPGGGPPPGRNPDIFPDLSLNLVSFSQCAPATGPHPECAPGAGPPPLPPPE